LAPIGKALWLMQSFQECGWASFVSLGAGLVALIIGIAALGVALGKPRAGVLLGALALIFSFGPPVVGFLGMLWGRHQTDAILASGVIDASVGNELQTQGYSEAAQCIPVGISIGVLPFVLASVALVIAASRKASEQKE
jgi:hypothetical protein